METQRDYHKENQAIKEESRVFKSISWRLTIENRRSLQKKSTKRKLLMNVNRGGITYIMYNFRPNSKHFFGYR